MALAEAAGLAKVGVEAVVGGIKSFQSGFNFMNDQLDKFAGKASGLGKVFEPVNKLIGSFFESLRRIGEFVVAGLIIRGIENIAGAIRKLGEAIFDSAAEFQNLQVRLEGLIAQDVLKENEKAMLNLNFAIEMASGRTEELFKWMQKLAVTTPVNTSDVAEVFTLAKSYGFATDGAKDLTEAIIDYTSYMGLSDVQMVRVIENFGQMIQQGKITGTELRDLARGALLPVNDLLLLMQENLGMTDISLEEFKGLVSDGTIEVNDFINAFLQMASTKWTGAGERANKTLQGMLSTVKELTIEMVGLNVAKPVLDVITSKFSDMLGALTQGDNFDRMVGALREIGGGLANVVEGFFNIAKFDAGTVAEGIISFLERLASKVGDIGNLFKLYSEGNLTFDAFIGAIEQMFNIDPAKMDRFLEIVTKISEIPEKLKAISEAFKEGGITAALEEIGVPEPIINFVVWIISAFNNLKFFLETEGPKILANLKPLLDEVMIAMGITPSPGGSILEKIGIIIWDLSQDLVANGPTITEKIGDIVDSITGEGGFLDKFGEFVDWISENKESILKFMLDVGTGMLTFALVAKVFLSASKIIALATFWAIGKLKDFVDIVLATFLILEKFLPGIFGWVSGVEEAIALILPSTQDERDNTVSEFEQFGSNIGEGFEAGLLSSMGGAESELDRLIEQATNVSPTQAYNNMYKYGQAMTDGLSNGIKNGIAKVQEQIGVLNNLILQKIKVDMQIQSPSKVFRMFGERMMEGLAVGINKGVLMPLRSMTSAMREIVQPAMNPVQSSVTHNTTTNNNFNLNVNTQAKAEPIIADFRMLQSFAGGN